MNRSNRRLCLLQSYCKRILKLSFHLTFLVPRLLSWNFTTDTFFLLISVPPDYLRPSFFPSTSYLMLFQFLVQEISFYMVGISIRFGLYCRQTKETIIEHDGRTMNQTWRPVVSVHTREESRKHERQERSTFR